MKKPTLLLLSVVFFLIKVSNSYSQCIPDTVTCRDTLLPGQICPEVLPDGYLGEPYYQSVTILPPSTAIFNEVPFTIVKIKIDTITNLPAGIVYEPNAKEFYRDTAYCVLLSGIPSETGEFKIAITVIPYVDLLGSVIEVPAVVDDTSMKITIYEPSKIKEIQYEGFYVIDTWPNPFTESTKLGFMINESSPVKLNVYNYLGILIYTETLHAKPGKNFFRFTGENISPGSYIYSIVNKKNIYSTKLIKSR